MMPKAIRKIERGVFPPVRHGESVVRKAVMPKARNEK
jgi:hypothetical protein